MTLVAELEGTGLLEGLDPDQRGQVLAAFKPYELGPDEVLLEEGESDRSMLVVLRGDLAVSLGGVTLATVGPGELVGEMAVFGSFDRRAATVTSLTGVRVAVLDEEGLRFLRLSDNPLARTLEKLAIRTVARRLREIDQRIVGRARGGPLPPPNQRGVLGKLASALGVGGELPRAAAPRVVDVLKATHGFAGRDDEILRAVAARLELSTHAAGDSILEADEPAAEAFIIGDGRVAVYCHLGGGRHERVATLGPGHVFGIAGLSDPALRGTTCRALEPCHLVRIPVRTFRALESENSPEGRAFRRGLVDALSVQLRLANEHFLTLHARPDLG